MTSAWAATPERGSSGALRLMVRIALGLGWRAAHAVLHPVTLFYLLTSPPRSAARRGNTWRARWDATRAGATCGGCISASPPPCSTASSC